MQKTETFFFIKKCSQREQENTQLRPPIANHFRRNHIANRALPKGRPLKCAHRIHTHTTVVDDTQLATIVNNCAHTEYATIFSFR